MSKIFIDGAHGTTGLVIQGLLKPFIEAGDVSLLSIENHRSEGERMEAFRQADVAVLCLPDDAAGQAVDMAESAKTRILDASSAHRTDPRFVYGFPEMTGDQKYLIRNATHVTNPGCYATGAVSLLRPVLDAGIVQRGARITVVGASGYTGGGKNLISLHENGDDAFFRSNEVAFYSINGQHKHVTEIQGHAGLGHTPTFVPTVLNTPRGMIVTIPFNTAATTSHADDFHDAYRKAYGGADSKIRVQMLSPTQTRVDFSQFAVLNARNSEEPPIDTLDIFVTGWAKNGNRQVNAFAIFDNLGKGAGTQALQNMRLMLNF